MCRFRGEFLQTVVSRRGRAALLLLLLGRWSILWCGILCIPIIELESRVTNLTDTVGGAEGDDKLATFDQLELLTGQFNLHQNRIIWVDFRLSIISIYSLHIFILYATQALFVLWLVTGTKNTA